MIEQGKRVAEVMARNSLMQLSRKPIESLLAPLSVGLCLLLYGLLFSIVFARVFQDGLCCGDDALNAIAAKNLAFGYGYGSSLLDSGVGIRLFDNAVTTGPLLN